MSGYVLKPAEGSVTWVMDWRRGHLAPGEAVTRDLGWSVQPDDPAEAGLRVVAQDHDGRRSWAALEGGAPGRVYLVTNRVRTSDDRVLGRGIVVRIASGAGPQIGSGAGPQ
jgi:hypothetical protein